MKKYYNKDWYIKNKALVIKRAKKWSKDNPDKRREIRNKWRKNNPEKQKECSLNWNLKNKDYYKKWGEKNKTYLKKYRKEYQSKNKDKMKEYQEKNKESLAEKRHKKYYANIDLSRKKAREDHKKNPFRKYRALGITTEEILNKKIEQKGLCAICKQKRHLCVDHCHVTKKLRGLLCRQCNVSLGLFKDNLDTLKNAVSYIEIYAKLKH
jgi:hypothetical protein